MNKEIIDILLKAIIKIYDINDNVIPFKTLSTKYYKKKHANNYSLHLFLDSKELLSNEYRSWKVEYKCRCGRINKILIRKYFLKEKLWCSHCCQDKSFNDFLLANYGGAKGKDIKDKKIKIKREYNFENESDDFKNNYWKSHLTKEEFYKYLPYIYSIDGIIINDNDTIEYFETFPSYNNIKYTSKIKINNILHPIKIQLLCSICNKSFTIHSYNIRKKDLTNIKCKTCAFNNHIYPIKLYDTFSGLTYQSLPEKYFIDKCKENNIKILNGIEIPYNWKKKKKIYISDFYLPEYKKIIEIKSDNRFYKNDLKSGKLLAKNNAAIDFGEKNNMSFNLVFDNEIDDFINNLLN